MIYNLPTLKTNFQTWQMPGSSGGMSLAASELSEQTRKVGISLLVSSDAMLRIGQVLRYVSEAVRRIEERHQAANKVEGVFTLELLTLRLAFLKLGGRDSDFSCM